MYWYIPLATLMAAAILTVILMCICFFKIFYSPKRKPVGEDEYPVPEGEIYEVHREQIVEWIKGIRALPHKDVEIQSFDGLTLRGKYFEQKKGAPLEILFHGYRGTSERDLCGGVYRCFALGRNALIVDHRGNGRSDGHVITFGAKESRDCLDWVQFAIKEIDPDVKIILTGISMGAATVMTAASMPLPKNVVGVLADCGYTSTEAIIKKVMRDMHLPANLLYPFARLSAVALGQFDPNASSPLSSMANCRLPVIFFHGDADNYVPLSMSEENYRACASAQKRLVVIPGAGHGLCFPIDQATYMQELKDFFAPVFLAQEIKE